MKSITSLAAIVLIRLPLDDIRPSHGIDSQTIEQKLKVRYGFPDASLTTQFNFQGLPPGIPQVGFAGTSMAFPLSVARPISLANGRMEIDDQVLGITNLLIVPDFSIIKLDVSNTRDGDEIAQDLLTFLETSFGFRDAKSKSFRHYGSSVVVQFDRPLEDMISGINKVQNLVSSIMRRSHDVNEDARIERLSFRCDPQQIPAQKLMFMDAFTIERRVGIDYSENRYFSGAPMTTDEHINALLEIEKAFL